MDRSGRVKRLLIGALVGAVCAAVAYGLLVALAKPDTYSNSLVSTNGGGFTRAGTAWKFVGYFTAVAFIVPASIVAFVLETRAKKRWRESRFPQAKQV